MAIAESAGIAIVSGRVPHELQRSIFETAARDDTKVARRLAFVSKHVRAWIEPILYECIILRSRRHVSALSDTISIKPKGFFTPIVHSLAIGDSLTLAQSKTILAACSQNIVNLAVWSNTRNPTVFLPFVKSHCIRRLALRSHQPSELSFPPTLLASLTHLMILEGPYTWFQLREAARNVKLNNNTTSTTKCPATTPDPNPNTTTTTQFNSLSHFAVSPQTWGLTQPLLNTLLAPNLKYFVILVPSCYKAKQVIAERVREIGDRRMVIVECEVTMENWEGAVRGRENLKGSVWEGEEKGVWGVAAKMVREGRFAQGEDGKWEL
ncbi:hypothetical protein H0H93_006926 [Arthromyces matolae]|nr:hypothetical protein H0H93_006926 [Arthromyces matolae]